ncbi:MAG: diaminopimelate decarboxylase [Chlorobium sp.]|uniref:diaminopimelate decarboxylase n=1 Tax=Chlorobium sp. TaxID=1095 RepID=UPI001DA73DAD|nr:diaminopimelate decarboxylase [Chlorobium sp.]MBN1279212.1 diaminopimelate decarboxylase [Chlorobiaceae bacterium]MCF8215689.1 diaminopimelate decarboxylase [Chlorobium sp.]MCF8270577.1 diaminopimelate decarboxylase [Chlorobium sp.]MCF8286898.1 diaminopimelate decarboxylase [Chlorobium sp.]MCF8290494.1 diaminopimelate decarboxylase [Chlorobium sp.]
MSERTVFHYIDDVLSCEDVCLDDLANAYGTPLYVTSKKSLLESAGEFEKAFASLPHLTCYSVKANFNLSVIRTFVETGFGCDVNSGGELFRALNAGVSGGKIIFAGVGKRDDEIAYALDSGVLMLKVESLSELRAIDRVAADKGVVAPIALRINPNVTAETHPYITTGDSKEKFGIDQTGLEEAFTLLGSLDSVRLVCLDMHIGSQIFDPEYYVAATEVLLDVFETAKGLGFSVGYLDIGGGFPVTYDARKPATPITHFAEKLIPLLAPAGVMVIFEPGRFLVANASVLLSRILYKKRNHTGKRFFIIDAGMTELIRPALYQSHHEVLSVHRHEDSVIADVVGPVCESSDFFCRQRVVDDADEGELLAVLSSGAYAAVMSSNYNGRLRPAEVMVDGSKARLIRRRESYDQLIANELF